MKTISFILIAFCLGFLIAMHFFSIEDVICNENQCQIYSKSGIIAEIGK